MRDINRCQGETSKAGGRRKEEQDAEVPHGREEDKAAEEGLDDGKCGVAPNEIRTSVSEEQNPPGAIRRQGDVSSAGTPTTAAVPTRNIRFGDDLLD